MYNALVIAIDNKLFYRGYRNPFWAQLGVAVRIDNHDSFTGSYSDTIESLNKKYGITRQRKVPNSRFLTELLSETDAMAYVGEFVAKISAEIDQLYAVHTIIPPSKVPLVTCYNGKIQMKPVEFVKSITGTYVHCVLWKLLDEGFCEANEPTELDYFEGHITNAWTRIREMKPKSEIYCSGDDCNPLISTADMLCKYIDDELRRRDLHLANEKLRECMQGSGLETTPVFLHDLSMITPRINQLMDTEKLIHHPLVFVFGSQMVKKEKDVIKSVGMFDKIANFAFERRAGLKFFDYDDPSKDASLMLKGDFFVGLGDKGISTANYFRTELGIDVDVRKGADIK